jgi:hypothetical protein
MACGICDGNDLTFLGTLGHLDWYRCRACGMDNCEESEMDVEDMSVLDTLAEEGCVPSTLDAGYCESHSQRFPCDRMDLEVIA